MTYEAGQLFHAEWDGDGSWRILRVLSVEGEAVEVELFDNAYTAAPSLEDLDYDTPVERHTLQADELALRWPTPLEPSPDRSTRRGLFQGLIVKGIEKGEDFASKRKPRWRF